MKHHALAPVLALCTLGFAAVAQATPCGNGGIFVPDSPPLACQNGGTGPNGNDKLSLINAGSGFFGQGNWLLLDKTDTVESGQSGLINGLLWSFSAGPPQGSAAGAFSLAGEIWDAYANLMVVMKAGNTFSAYELLAGVLDYTWEQAGRGLGLSHMSLYGVAGEPIISTTRIANDLPRTSVPEPATWAVLVLALAGGLTVQRRRLGLIRN